ncbi:MAG: response regulator [Lachnospiraceae bacterium]|nr:response regulator [Lachnospiraceae bacterium]
MQMKILVTGKNRKVAMDVCEHLENDRGYKTVRCDPNKKTLVDVMLTELPKVIVVCMGDETIDTISEFDVLRNTSGQGGFTTIIIANEDDERLFRKYTKVDKAFFLSRPVSLFALYEKLISIEKELEDDEKSGQAREFVNENARRRKQILVVDDDSEQLIHIKEELEEFYDVTPVRNAEAVFKYLSKKTPDLILLDYLMPEKDGPQVLREMREVEEYAKIPVIFLTGMTERNAILKTIAELRPQGYIVKPSKKSELVAKIIDVLG